MSPHSHTIVIGSRGSALALWQANYISAQLHALGFASRTEVIKTTGDQLQTASLVQAGGKGLFTKEIEEALLAGSIDVAVHSLKDLPTANPEGLTIAAIPERESPFDAMVGARVSELAPGARVGTSSNRRGAQLRALRSDLDIQPVRGNVDTRLRKLDEGQYAAIMLATAGLRRLGLNGRISQVFEPEEICPAPGQGALGVQTRAGDRVEQICRALNHQDTADCVTAERLVLAELGGGCQLPVGVYAEVKEEQLHLQAVVISPDGRACLRTAHTGTRSQLHSLAMLTANDLLHQGAASLLAEGVA